jgi:hypothetical protein
VKRLPWLVAAVMAYETYAVETHNAPTISHIVRTTRQHFWSKCPTCGQELVHARPRYRGYMRVAGR